MIFVGYECGTKAYHAYDPVLRRVHITRDVVFDEDAQWDWAGSPEEHAANVHGDDIFRVEMMTIGYGGQTQDPSAAPSTPSAPRTPASAPTSISTERATPTDIQFVSPLPNLDEGLDADHDEDAPLRFRPVDDVVGPGTPPGPIERDLEENRLLAISAEEPASLIQAKQEACWRRAMEEEQQAIEDNGTWTLIDLPQGRRAIGLKWVFKVKKDEHGAVVRYKARLIVKGYAQRQGVDYDEVFAPVARMEAVRLLLALAAQNGWEVHHMDVKTAFLNGELQEEVFVE
jgi:hypothetical protein